MQASSTLAPCKAAEALRAQGANVVDFGAGEPDFDTPDNIKRAAEAAMARPAGQSTRQRAARVNCKQAIIDFYARNISLPSDEYNEVMATSGGKQAIFFNAVVSLNQSGDEY